MNYHALSRRELQALCKQHKIPANKTNVFMADSLTALLSVSEKAVVTAAKSPSKDASTDIIEESMGEVVIDSGDSGDVCVKSPDVKQRKNRVDSGIEDMCSVAKPRTKRISIRGKIAPLAILTTTEDLPTIRPASEEEAKPATRAAKKPALKSKNARALVKAAIAPDSPGSGYASSSITREEEPEILSEVHFAVRCDRSHRFGKSEEQDDRYEGNAGSADAEVLKLRYRVGGSNMEIQSTEFENVIVPVVVEALHPEGTLNNVGHIHAPTKDSTGKETAQKVSLRRTLSKRTVTGKKAVMNLLPATVPDIPIAFEVDGVIPSEANPGNTNAVGRPRKGALPVSLPVEMETLHVVPDSVRHNGSHQPQKMMIESQAQVAEKSKPAIKGGRKVKRITPALSPVEQVPATSDDRPFNNVEDFHFGPDQAVVSEQRVEDDAEPNLTSKKGIKTRKGPRASQAPKESGADPVALSGEEPRDDIGTKKPIVKESKPTTRKVKKTKKGDRPTNPPVDLEAPEATVGPRECETVGLGGEGHSADMVKELVPVEPKVATQKVTTTKRKLKTKTAKKNASSPVLEVYEDTDFASKVTNDAKESELLKCPANRGDVLSSHLRSPSLANMKDSSPMKSPSVSQREEDSTSPVKSPSLAHLVGNTPIRSPSFSYVENGSDYGSSDTEPNQSGNQVALEPNSFGTNTFSAGEADKENSGRKVGTEIPKSLRKLRKQVKEAIIKKNITPVSSPLKDISLNIRSPQSLTATSFSFNF